MLGMWVGVKYKSQQTVRYGLVVRIPGSHPGGPGSIPGNGNLFPAGINFSKIMRPCVNRPDSIHDGEPDAKNVDEDGIRTHACRAHWISSPTP